MKTRSLAHGNHRRLDGSTMVAMHGILASHGIIPPSILSRYNRRIYVLELMAALIALVALHAQLSHYVVLGLTRQDLQLSPRVIDVIDILTFLYCFLARAGILLHCEWVPSAHKLADAISRRDLTEVQHGGWKLLNSASCATTSQDSTTLCR